jgi:hypothetical protein
MPVPKATMNEEHCSVLWKNNIGLAGQILTVQSEAISKPVKERSHYSLGDSVSALDARHIPTTTFLRDSVSHDCIMPEIVQLFKRVCQREPRFALREEGEQHSRHAGIVSW